MFQGNQELLGTGHQIYIFFFWYQTKWKTIWFFLKVENKLKTSHFVYTYEKKNLINTGQNFRYNLAHSKGEKNSKQRTSSQFTN